MSEFGVGDVIRVKNPDHAMNGETGRIIADRSDGLFARNVNPPCGRYFIDFTPKYGLRDTLLGNDLVLVEKNTKIRKRVYYAVNYCATVEYDPAEEDLDDVISNIDIPEGGEHNSEYQSDSFDAYEIEDA